ncbi:MAG: hypothetical protein FWF34_02765, partial [Alphaproteobacteria bacterium]|nr:hypothetical protein [Alphaproteobacteria bacterium]
GPIGDQGPIGPAGILDNQGANIVYAGPASGGNAAPTFRALTATDIPNAMPIAKIDPASIVTQTQVNSAAPDAALVSGAIMHSNVNSVPTAQPSGSLPAGRAWIWVQ